MYPTYPLAAERAASVVPHAKLIYLVRNPVHRLISHYQHQWYAARIEEGFPEALRKYPELVNYSKYFTQIEQWLKYFPKSRWLVLFSEDFFARPLGVNQRVSEFLQIDTDHVCYDLKPRNTTSNKVRLRGWARAMVRLPGLQNALRGGVPASAYEKLRRLGGRKQPEVEITPKLRRHLLDILVPDVEALSEFISCDMLKFWKLEC
jgi:hypothetical protein